MVSGTTGGGTGGSLAFSSLFAAGKAVTLSGSVGATTLTLAQMPKHTHKYGRQSSNLGYYGGGWGALEFTDPDTFGIETVSAGSSSSHTHTLSGSAKIALNVKYTDVIICAKA